MKTANNTRKITRLESRVCRLRNARTLAGSWQDALADALWGKAQAMRKSTESNMKITCSDQKARPEDYLPPSPESFIDIQGVSLNRENAMLLQAKLNRLLPSPLTVENERLRTALQSIAVNSATAHSQATGAAKYDLANINTQAQEALK